MSKKLSLATAKGAMNVVLNEAAINTARSLGCTEAEWELLTGPKPWSGKERHIIKRQLDQLLYGMLESMGLPKFELPAEFAATVIVTFVKECNYFSACSWLGNFHKAEELGNVDGSMPTTEGMEKTTAQQLFALVLIINSDEQIDIIARRFLDKTKITLGFTPKENKK